MTTVATQTNQDPLMTIADIQQKIRAQFDGLPYPVVPLDKSPQHDPEFLFIHNLVTPYYLRYQRVIDTEGMVILDAGCGSGYKALALAIANPGAQIVGIDLSATSLEVAAQRLHHHGVANAEFHQITLEQLPSLGIQFDYINCDEVMSILPDITTGLKAFRSVLKPQGIIRGNLHSARQRRHYYAAQTMFKMMHLMDGNPEELERDIVRETMAALKDTVQLKQSTWHEQRGQDDQFILMNYLYQGDRGYTIRDLFAALRAADLEFVSMVDWHKWELLSLFKDPNDLPPFWAMSLPELSAEERLALFELIQPVNRLIDFWCGHPQPELVPKPVIHWSAEDWQGATVYLHPQLRTEAVRAAMHTSIADRTSFCISDYLHHPTATPITLESGVTALLLKLWENPQSIAALANYWQRLKPVHPVTLASVTPEIAFAQVTQVLARLETSLYVLVDQHSRN